MNIHIPNSHVMTKRSSVITIQSVSKFCFCEGIVEERVGGSTRCLTGAVAVIVKRLDTTLAKAVCFTNAYSVNLNVNYLASTCCKMHSGNLLYLYKGQQLNGNITLNLVSRQTQLSSFFTPSRSENEPGDTETRRTIRYPDSHQLFVGNLPHDIDETELKEFFTGYGNVVELRINTKSSGGKLPNFGFVVFDDPEPVQKILSSKPIKFRGELRLNVEEKKTRPIREGERRGDDRRENRPRGPGGPRGGLGGGMMRDREGRGG
eukprot:g45556.t1